jgi:hypothetical protein
VRVVGAFLVIAAVGASAAFAISVDPKVLVIRPSDIPAGYAVVRSESGLRTNEQEAKTPEVGRLFRRWGRVTGYQMIFDRGERTIEARADVFRSASGARKEKSTAPPWAARSVGPE